MRQLKFRIWNPNKKQWEDPNKFATILFNGETFECESTPTSYSWREPLWTYEVQQWTGLVDVKGQDIYEGDIVKYSRLRLITTENPTGVFNTKAIEDGDFVGEIIFISPGFCWSYEHKRYDDIEPMTQASHRYEIIGNIFENPELLEL